MKRLTSFVGGVALAGAALVLLVEAGGILHADPAGGSNVLYQTGFEPPTFIAGRRVAGQGGFRFDFSRNAGVVSTRNPRTGLQVLQINGQRLAPLPSPNVGLVGAGYFPVINYDTHANKRPIIDIHVSVRLDGPSTDRGQGRADDFISANLSARTESTTPVANDLGGLILSSNGHVYAFSGDAIYMFDTRVRRGQYHTLGLRVNFVRRRTAFFLNGQLLGSLPFHPSVNSRVFGGARLDLTAVGPPSFDPSPYTAYFDNYLITAEPFAG